MALIDWSEALSVGIVEIDQQHKRLIGIINELYDAMRAGQAQEMLAEILLRLKDYTHTHFAYEERNMSGSGFEDLYEHKREHDAFIKKIAEFVTAFNAGQTALSGELLVYLRDWLESHIKGTDKKYVPSLLKYGVR